MMLLLVSYGCGLLVVLYPVTTAFSTTSSHRPAFTACCSSSWSSSSLLATVIESSKSQQQIRRRERLEGRRRRRSASFLSLSSSSSSPSSSSTSSTTTSATKSSTSEVDDPSSVRYNVRSLGVGPDAIVRLGCVLVAPQYEYSHYYQRAAIFIMDIGPAQHEQQSNDTAAKSKKNKGKTSDTQENDDTDNNDKNNTVETEEEGEEYLIRGVIIDHPTPFLLHEMMDKTSVQQNDENNASGMKNPLLMGDQSIIFRGGDKGGKGVILLHSRPDWVDQQKQQQQSSIGGSGIYQGGWDTAIQANENIRSTTTPTTAGTTANASLSSSTSSTSTNSDDYKIFFNYCEFTEKQLTQLFDSVRVDDHGGITDAWMSVEVEPSFILNHNWGRGEAWAYIRNSMWHTS